MKRYIIRPVGHRQHTQAWANTLDKAQELKEHLQTATGLKWTITEQDYFR